MSVEREISFQARLLPAGEFRSGLRRTLVAVFGEGASASVFRERRLSDGTVHYEHGSSLDTLEEVCDLSRAEASFSVTAGPPGSGSSRALSLIFHGDRAGYLDVVVEAADLQVLSAFTAAFATELRLTASPTFRERTAAAMDRAKANAGPSIPAELESLKARVRIVEEALIADVPALTVFLSYPFSGRAVDYGREVRRFLELLDIEVLTGEGYEPRPIHEKVKGRLSQGIDAVVLIEVADRKSMWTRDEIGPTQSSDVFLFPIVEEGAQFEPGIYGDHERIDFSAGHIGDAFIALLEGIQYVRRVRHAERTDALVAEQPH